MTTPATASPPESSATLTLDGTQFERIFALLAPPPKPAWTLDRILKLLQVLSIIGGVAAAYYALRAYQRDEHSFKLAQREFDLKMAQGETSLRADMVSLSKAQSPRIAWEWDDLKILRVGQAHVAREHGLYQVTVRLRATNISDTPLQIDYNWLRYYVAEPLSTGVALMPVDPPPGADSQSVGPKWREVGSTLYGVPSWEQGRSPEQLGRFNTAARRGGACGEIRPGESLTWQAEFLANGSEDNWVGFTLEVGIKGDATPWTMRKFRLLGPLSPTRAQSEPAEPTAGMP